MGASAFAWADDIDMFREGHEPTGGWFQRVKKAGGTIAIFRRHASVDAEGLSKRGAFDEIQWMKVDRAQLADDIGSLLSRMVSLQGLELYGVSLSHAAMKVIGTLRNLKVFSCVRCKVERGAFGHLSSLPSIEYMDLSSTNMDDARLDAFANLKTLRSLSLPNTQVNGVGVRHLKELSQLRFLNLGATRLTDRGLREIPPLPSLEAIRLSNTRLSDAGLRPLMRLPKLVAIIVDRTRIRGHGFAALSPLKHFRRLYAHRAAIDDQGARALSSLRLTRLDLRRTRISDRAWRSILNPELEEITLRGTAVGDGGHAALAQATALTSLDLGETRISDLTLGALGQLRQLKRIAVDCTAVTSAGVAKLKAVRPDLESTETWMPCQSKKRVK